LCGKDSNSSKQCLRVGKWENNVLYCGCSFYYFRDL